MKKVLILITMLLPLLQISHAQTARDHVWNLVVSLDDALVKKDSIRLYSLLTEDFIGAVPTGQSYTRPMYIRFHCKPDVGLVSIEEEGSEAFVRMYGNSAIVNRRVRVVRKAPDGSARELTVQRIEVCVLVNGSWYVASGQGTEVALQ
jgi:hypothetical protein